MRRRILPIIFTAVLALATVAPASAGGWAFAQLVLPFGPVVAGEEIVVDIQILQHGVPDRLSSGGGPLTIKATHRSTGETIEGMATAIGDGTTYRAQMIFPKPGEYKWTSTAGPFPTVSALPTLTVLPATGVSTAVAHSVEEATSVTIVIDDTGFRIMAAAIHAGEPITWVNQGSLAHQVMADNLAFEDLPILQPGQSFRTTIDEPGSYTIFCPPHPGMVGTLDVLP